MSTLKLMQYFDDVASSSSPSLNLRSCRLTTMPVAIAPLLLAVRDLTLDANELTGARALRYAARAQRVSLAENTHLVDFALELSELRELEFVGVPCCGIATAEELAPLTSLPKLGRLLIAENAVCEDELELRKVMDMFEKCRVMPFWL